MSDKTWQNVLLETIPPSTKSLFISILLFSNILVISLVWNVIEWKADVTMSLSVVSCVIPLKPPLISESQNGAPRPLKAGKNRTLFEFPSIFMKFSLSFASLKIFILSLSHWIIFPEE